METGKYRVVTTGEIHSGFVLCEVQKNLAGLCKYNQDKLERIFSGNPFVFETDHDLITARRYKNSLDQTGIVCQVEPLTPITRKQQAGHSPSSLPAKRTMKYLNVQSVVLHTMARQCAPRAELFRRNILKDKGSGSRPQQLP